LADFEGLPVTAAAVEIPNAGGGLRDALKVDPVELHSGETVHVVLRCEVGKVRFDPIERDEPAGAPRRVHVLTTITAAIVGGGDTVGDALDAQSERIAAAGQLDGQLTMDEGGA
jgi:hypothetical protein